MKTVFENDFITCTYDEGKKFMDFTWKHTDGLEEEPFRELMLKEKDLISEYETKALLIDTLKFEFTILPETQEWIASEVVAKWFEAGVRKVAFVVPSDIFAQVSIEQVWDEDGATTFDPKYFDDTEEARKWVLR